MGPFTSGVDSKGIPLPSYFSSRVSQILRYCDNSGLAFRYVLLSRANALYDCADKKRKTALARGWPGLLARGRWQKRRGGHAPCICAYNPQLVLRCPVKFMGLSMSKLPFLPTPTITATLSLSFDRSSLELHRRPITNL